MVRWGLRETGIVVALVLVGCNTPPPKQAEGCPPGTMLRGDSCVPTEDSTSSSKPEPTHTAEPSGDNGSTSTTGSVPYDKEAVEGVLKRAARQVKANCGGAVDAAGKVSGPWGPTKITVKIGHNGHTKDASVPPPFDGKATGTCAVTAFTNLVYPPFAGPDQSIDWDIEIVEPKK